MVRYRKSDLPRDELGRLRAPGEPDDMAHLRDLGDRVPSAEEALRRGVALFSRERFFESYVHFALAWKRTRAVGHRGLAQLAAGLCQLQRGNVDGAERILSRAEEALRVDTPPGVDSARLLRRAASYRISLGA
jgi:hypothetical protein